MSGHTPGPWWFGFMSYDGDGNEVPSPQPVEYSGRGYGGNPFIFGPDGRRVVGNDEYDVFGDWDSTRESRATDIRLLLAAPELLEACQSIVEWLRAEEGAEPYDKDNGVAFYDRVAMCDRAMQQARTAIAKATGETA